MNEIAARCKEEVERIAKDFEKSQAEMTECLEQAKEKAKTYKGKARQYKEDCDRKDQRIETLEKMLKDGDKKVQRLEHKQKAAMKDVARENEVTEAKLTMQIEMLQDQLDKAREQNSSQIREIEQLRE